MTRLLACLALLVTAAHAGPDADDQDDHGPDEGPVFFGFVKDAGGVPVRDARVSASYRKSLTLMTRSNAAGAYKLRGFKKDVVPDEVVISCAKEGYRQVRVFRYPPPRNRPIKSVETECRLQREKS
jgi:hypothetical protein